MTYCAACHRAVARADRVEREGEVYHRQCAPDDYPDVVTVVAEPREDENRA